MYVLFVPCSVTQECAVCCMAFTPDSSGITVMDTKGHLYPLELETQDIDVDQEDFTEDFREGSEMDVSIQPIPFAVFGWMKVNLHLQRLVAYLLILFRYFCHVMYVHRVCILNLMMHTLSSAYVLVLHYTLSMQ